MEQQIFIIASNEKIAKDIYKIVLSGNVDDVTKPGGFVNIKIDGFYLRRPLSVCDVEKNNLVLIYKVVGKGTQKLSTMTTGEELDILTGLGNGYDLSKSNDAPLLVGGGVGVPPLYFLCKKLREQNKKVIVVMGFKSADEVFYEDEFKALGAEVYVTTEDGSHGTKGFVTNVIKDLDYSYFYSCGPEAMFKAMDKIMKTSGQYSFEERMGCGFGACMGCTCKTKYKNKRICRDGPVLEREEIIW